MYQDESEKKQRASQNSNAQAKRAQQLKDANQQKKQIEHNQRIHTNGAPAQQACEWVTEGETLDYYRTYGFSRPRSRQTAQLKLKNAAEVSDEKANDNINGDNQASMTLSNTLDTANVKQDKLSNQITVIFNVKKAYYNDDAAKVLGKPAGGLQEYERQLAAQQNGINKLPINKWQANRARYLEEGRHPASSGNQKRARERMESETIERIIKEAKERGVVLKFPQAKAMVKNYVALHDPDQVAGGEASNITSLGRRDINASIGAQWRYRIQAVDAMVAKISSKLTTQEQSRVTMNTRLTIRKV